MILLFDLYLTSMTFFIIFVTIVSLVRSAVSFSIIVILEFNVAAIVDAVAILQNFVSKGIFHLYTTRVRSLQTYWDLST